MGSQILHSIFHETIHTTGTERLQVSDDGLNEQVVPGDTSESPGIWRGRFDARFATKGLKLQETKKWENKIKSRLVKNVSLVHDCEANCEKDKFEIESKEYK